MNQIFHIEAGAPFLRLLARGLPLIAGRQFERALVLLPNRRSCAAFRDVLFEEFGERSLLLPKIRPVGDIDLETGAFSEMLDLPPVIDPIYRQLLLARLIRSQKAAESQSITDEHSLRLAKDLARFLDELKNENTNLEPLLEMEMENLDLAEHWQETLTFLTIIGRHWPTLLNASNLMDANDRRNIALKLAAAKIAKDQNRPVIAAGISGSIPLVATLLKTIAQKKGNAVVLFGLDQGASKNQWRAIKKTPSNPQYNFANFLADMELDRDLVSAWPAKPDQSTAQKAELWHSVTRPPASPSEKTINPEKIRQSLADCEWLECKNLPEEALSIALRIRQHAINDDRPVCVVTQDRQLARRIQIELERFEIESDDSAGTPLDQTPVGSFFLLAAKGLAHEFSSLAFLSMLKHPLAQGSIERPLFKKLIRRLEIRFLRGPRSAGTSKKQLELLTSLAKEHDETELACWLEDLTQAAGGFLSEGEKVRCGITTLLDQHLAFLNWLAGDTEGETRTLWSRQAGEALAGFIRSLNQGADAGFEINPDAYPALLAIFMTDIPVRPIHKANARVQILGQFESRLADYGLTVIAGLNEGVWPVTPSPSPWVNRKMRALINLPDPEAVTGQSALDFLQLASAPKTLFTRSRKDALGNPQKPSRWLVKLRSHLAQYGCEQILRPCPSWQEWVKLIDRPPATGLGTAPPRPSPPLPARPKEFWVTDVERLMRNPYEYYVRRVLRLEELEALDAEPDSSERGMILHKIFEKFVRQYPGNLPDNAKDELLKTGAAIFRALDHFPQVQALWWPKFLAMTDLFIALERQKRDRITKIWTEQTGKIQLQSQRVCFELKARADRIEEHNRTATAIVDYKSGSIPSQTDIQSGKSPQLTLSGLIAGKGGFGNRDKNIAELSYLALKPGPEQFKETVVKAREKDLSTLIEEAEAGIIKLMEHFLASQTPYFAVARPEVARQTAIDHLARTDEWREG